MAGDSPSQFESLASLDCLAVEAESVVHDYRAIDQAMTDFRMRVSRLGPEEAVVKIDQIIALLIALTFDENKLHELILRITGGRRCASREEIGEHIALLLGSFPYSNAPDPDVYARMMIEEIAAAEPSLMALDAACRSLRRSLRWLPTIAQVLDALAAETETWKERLDCAQDVMEHHTRAILNLRELRRRMANKESRERLVRRLGALKSELEQAEREGRSRGHRWRWEIQLDIDRAHQELVGL